MQAPGPDVMRLRVGITEAGKTIPVLDNLTAAIPIAMVLSKGKKYIGGTEAFVGKATIEGELADSQTGELLAAGVDRRGVASTPGSRWSAGAMSKRP